jgi:putative transposase
MKKSRFSDAQIMGILAQAENGVPITELCREHGMSNASFYKWRAKYGGLDASMVSQMKSMDTSRHLLTQLPAGPWMRISVCRRCTQNSACKMTY